MKLKIFAQKKNKAQAIVEFAIVLPILLLLLYGLLEAGRLLFMYSSVVTASRQAARYGSATGQGTDFSTDGGPDNSSVNRYQDCYGIKQAAQRADFLNAFGDDDITIRYDNGTVGGNPGFEPNCDGPADNTVHPSDQNTTRIEVTVTGHFDALVPLVPFHDRLIVASSARTILMAVSIPVAGSGGAAATTVTVDTDPNPSQPGQPVTASVTVTSASGTPTGTVLISAGGSNCTVTLSGGTGTCANPYLFSTTTTVTAAYTPADASAFSPSSGSVVHVVGAANTITTVIDTADPSVVGQTVTIYITVANEFGMGDTPAGTVAVTTAAGPCNITLSGGQGQCTVTFNTLGWSTITASYTPTDVNVHLPSTGDSPHEVLTGTPTPSLTPAVPTAVPTTPVPPTAIPPTPVSGCNSIRDTAGTITLSGKTMYLDMSNASNPYPVTVDSVYVAWNYAAGHVPGDSSLWLQSADLNGTIFWTGNLNKQDAKLPLSTAVVIPANGTARVTFTFDKTYNRAGGEQVQVFFSTPGCETYPVIRPVGVPTITPAPPADLKVQLISGGTDNNQQTQFRFQVLNTGTAAVSNISVRIYFGIDSPNKETDYVLEKYWDESGVATISGPTQVTNKIYYFTINYGAASLPAGGKWEFQTSLHLNGWGATYVATDDWWHTASALPAVWTDWPTIPAYVDGLRVWGTEP
ncbi:MAG: pilus assembly protein [Anaerolineales bacterium]|nr:pilus assembly protein [Anaerolineales bacterium]